MGVVENEWNVSLAGPVPRAFGSIRYTLAFGDEKRVSLTGSGYPLAAFVADGVRVPSRVMPLRLAKSGKWEILLGRATGPYLERLNAILHDANYTEKDGKLRLELSSFTGHHIVAEVVSRERSRRIRLDGKTIPTSSTRQNTDGSMTTTVRFIGSPRTQQLEFQF
jgi:hypothetical protein